MRSSGSRSTFAPRREPESFHGAVLGTRRPLGYSGVSQTQRRPFSSQSRFMTLLMSGSEATRLTLNSGCTSSLAAAFDGAVGPPAG
jgi:hypothetical protein